MYGLKPWAKMEIRRQGAKDLATAISIAESLEEYQKPDKGKKVSEGANNGGREHVKEATSSMTPNGKNGSQKWEKTHKNGQKRSCYTCFGEHHSSVCPLKHKVAAMVAEHQAAQQQSTEGQSMGSLVLHSAAIKTDIAAVSEAKGRLFANIKIGRGEVDALIDTGATNNFIELKAAEKLGISFSAQIY